MANSHAKIRRIMGVTGNDEISELVSAEGHPSLLESSRIWPFETSLEVAELNQDPASGPALEVITIESA